jgi:aspartyl protease family protein
MNTEEHSPRKVGIGMLVIAWAIIFGLLGLFFNDMLEQQINPNTEPLSYRNQQQVEVVLVANRQHHYVVNGNINHQPVVFMLDTGATEVVIPERLAQRLGLDKGGRQLASTANGTVVVYSTVIDHLTIGDIKLQKVRASINPAMKSEVILLGMSALKHIEFTQRADSLILRQTR